MPEPILHKYFDFGDRSLANVTLASGHRVLLTIVPNGFAVHRLHLRGMIPGICLFGTREHNAMRMADVLMRDGPQLPPLPRAKGTHRIEPAARSASDSARAESGSGERPFALLTRLALMARDEGDLVRIFERIRNPPG